MPKRAHYSARRSSSGIFPHYLRTNYALIAYAGLLKLRECECPFGHCHAA